jgi:hypothetical protein
MTFQPSARHYERSWVQGWFYNAVYAGLLFRGEQNIWKQDPATVTENIAATGYVQTGSWHKWVTVANFGQLPEYIGVNETVYANGVPVENHFTMVWLSPNGTKSSTYSFAASGTETGAITLTIAIIRYNSYGYNTPTLHISYYILGDVGQRIGSTNLFFMFDGQVKGEDVYLVRLLFKYGYDAYPTQYFIGDLGSRVGAVNKFFIFDGKVKGEDVYLLRLCFKGIAPPYVP